MTTTPLTDQQLADRIAAELTRHYAIAPNNDGTVICNCGDRVKADHQRQAFREHTAAAIFALMRPEADRLRAELAIAQAQLAAVREQALTPQEARLLAERDHTMTTAYNRAVLLGPRGES